MGLNLQYHAGQTPIDEEEKDELLLTTISTRGELDEVEQSNIANAIEWSIKRKFSQDKILSPGFLRELHQRMFSEVWEWAGKYRKTNKNLGVDKFTIEQELIKLLDDGKFWIEHKIYPSDEIAIRLKYRMVSIHPFPNGNGRHSRIYADIFISHIFNLPVFSWGGRNLNYEGENRLRYLRALYQADQGNIQALIQFARS